MSLALPAVLGGLLTAGCVPWESITSVSQVAATASSEPQLNSPLSPYMLTWRELTVVNHARSVLVSECLDRHGFELPADDLASLLAAARTQELIDLARMWGITDAAIAQEHGYLPPPTHVSTPDATHIPEAPLEECAAQADRAVDRRADRSAYGIARELLIQNRQTLESRPESSRPIADWRACMREAGHTVTSPLADQGDIAAQLRDREGHAPSASEISMALADVSCKEQTGLVAAMDRAAIANEAKLARRHRKVLMADRRRLDAVHRLSSSISRRASQAQVEGDR